MKRPTEVRHQLELVTHSGSRYRVLQTEGGGWWMSGDNVANPTSCRLDPDEWWPIRRPHPWPPELGQSIELLPPEELDRDDPHRCPGGGKRTSPVRAIRHPS